jgi:hypothetical protein
MERLTRVRRLLPRRVYYWVDDRLSARLGEQWHWRNSDDNDNDRGIPPSDERITWHGVWIAEAFLPATARALPAGLERLGWWDSFREQSIAEIIAERRSGRGGGWANLPLLRRRTKGWPSVFPSVPKDLPAGVEYVSGHLHFLTPSLTVLIAGFRFDASVSSELDAALRMRYRTYYKRLNGRRGSTVMDPTAQRRDAVRVLRET